MSTLSFDDSSNLVDVTAPTNGEEKEEASGDSKQKQPDLLLLDEPEVNDIVEHQETKSKSKKSKAKKLLKRAKSPISGAINKTTKEFKKLSSLPKHHHTSQKSPVKSPSRENLTEEYSKLEKKLAEKDSEEWKQYLQMQERVQQLVLKTQSSLSKYSSHSDEEQSKEGKYSTKWTGFEEEDGLEPEVIDTSLNPEINVTDSSDIISIDTIDLLDSKEESNLINTSFIDTQPLSPLLVSGPDTIMDNISDDHTNKTEETVQSGDDILGLVEDSIPVKDPEINTVNKTSDTGLIGLENFTLDSTSSKQDITCSENTSEVPVLSGYTFTSSMSSDTNAPCNESKSAVNSEILMFEQPLTPASPVTCAPQPVISSPPMAVENNQSKTPAASGADLFSLDEDMLDATAAPTAVESKPSVVPDPLLSLLGGEPLQPLQPSTVTTSTHKDQIVPDILDQLASKPSETITATSLSDDFASFDPMKSSSNFMQYGTTSGSSSSVQSAGMCFSTSPQTQGMTYGSVPTSSVQTDIFSKIKMLSGNQSVSPVKRRVAEKPKDPFSFVKKDLKGGEEDDGYKSMADLKKKDKETNIAESKQTCEDNQSDLSGIDNLDTSTVNNPFMSESFSENMAMSEGFTSANAAALFGLEPETTTNVDTGFDIFMATETEARNESNNLDGFLDIEQTKPPAEPTTVAKTGWVDATNLDHVDFGEEDMDANWEDDKMHKEKKTDANAWGGEEDVLVKSQEIESDNPFKDDFSNIEEIPQVTQKEIANPFLSDTAQPPASAAVNPFLDINNESIESSGVDFLGSSIAKPAVLSDSESFFFDSVAESKPEPGQVAEDVFDPFKVTSDTKEQNLGDPLDLFSSAAAAGDKQLAKPSADDDFGFTLDIKPVGEGEKSGVGDLPVAPALAPPPKAPKSPQPPRENPFDRDSPPEENFAQFEVMDTEKTKEVKEMVPKSMSTESGTATTEEEEEEVDLPPLEPYLPECERDSFKLMLRYPTKKKLAGNRYWKNVSVKLEKQKDGLMVKVLNDARDPLAIQELLLQPCYSLSDLTLQQYDQYGKIHTVKLQYVFYKERVGIKTERITPSIVKFKKRSEKPKATMILDHSPQVSELLKFGSLDKPEIMQFIQKLEDAFMNLEAHREKTLTYTKDEVTAEVRDEYYAELDKDGKVLMQKARARVFVLAFLSGMPVVEIGLNDKRRQGKEVVGRCDIIPIKTEEWIKLEDVQFHGCVDKEDFEKTNNIKFRPLDACQFELMRYRVRLRENKELPLQLTIQQILKNKKCEIRCDLLVTGYHSYSKKHGQFPCEDIEVRFPIPEVWIYMFRYERRFGYGSVHSAARKPGKIKGKHILFLKFHCLHQL